MGILYRCYRYCRNILLGLLAIALIAAVIAVIAVNRLQDMQSQVVELLRQTTGRNITFQTLDGGWAGLNPQLVATQVEVNPIRDGSSRQGSKGAVRPLLLQRLQLELSLPDLLLGRLVPKVLKIKAPVLHFRLNEKNRLVIDELVLGGAAGATDYRWLSDLAGLRLVISDARLIWYNRDGSNFPIQASLSMQTRNNKTVVTGQLQAAGGQSMLQLTVRGLASAQPQANCSLRVQNLRWQDLPTSLRTLAPRVKKGEINGNLQCYWAKGALQQITGRTLLEELDLSLSPGNLLLDSLRSSLQWSRGQDGWRSVLRDITLRRNQQNVTISRLSVRQLGKNDFQIKIPNAPLSAAFQLWRAAVTDIPDNLSALTALKGQASSLQARLQTTPQGLKITELQSDCDNCSLALRQPQRSLPRMSGRLHWSPAGGSAIIETATGNIVWPTLWKMPITLQKGQTSVRWQAETSGWKINLQKLRLQIPEITLSATAEIQLNQQLQPGKLKVSLQQSSGKITALRAMLPITLASKVRQWFTNTLQGGTFRIEQGKISGNLQANDFFTQGTVAGRITLEQASLRPVAKWPALEAIAGRLELKNRQLNFIVKQANFAKQRITNLQGSVSGLGTADSLLTVNGQVNGEIAELLAFIQNQQLDRGATKSLIRSVHGNGTLDLSLKYALAKKAQTTFSGIYYFQNQSLTLPSGLQLEDIQGKLIFDNNHIAATGLSATAFSGPVAMDLFYTFKPGIREIKASGESDVPDLLKFAGDKFSGLATGRLRWQGSWQNNEQTNTFTLQSTLKGVALGLPAPLQKEATTKWPITLRVTQQQAALALMLDAGKVLQVKLDYVRQAQKLRLQNANIAVGTELLEQPSKRGLLLRVNTNRFNWDTWGNTLDRFSSTDSDSPALPILGITLKTRNMYAMSRPWGLVNMALTPSQTQAQTLGLKISGDRMQGSGTYRKISDRRSLQLDMQYFHWPKAKKIQASSSSNPDTWPDLTLHVGDFRYGTMQLGQLNLLSESRPGFLQINSLQLLRNDLMMQVDGYWKAGQNPDNTLGNTVFNFQAGSIDLGSVVDSLGFKQQLQAGVADLEGQLQWPGRPADFQVAQVNGQLEFHSREGSILGVKPGSGRFLGLLNADALLQRLRLDFSDLTGDGLSYNEMEAKAHLDSGNLMIDKLQIFSTVALVDIRGRIGLGAEDYDMKMTVAPQLGGNVSLLSALLNPIAGAAIFLLNKVFRDQINQWLRYEYKISGDWKKPQIKKIVLQANQKEPDEFRGVR